MFDRAVTAVHFGTCAANSSKQIAMCLAITDQSAGRTADRWRLGDDLTKYYIGESKD